MDVFEGHRTLVERLPAPCVAIGNFDGVHLGHRALLDTARRRADEQGGVAIALTFDPHPTTVLAPHLAQPLITGRPRKLELLAAAGMDAVIIEPFTTEFATQASDDFVDNVLIRAIGVRHVVVGWDFSYGARRAGTTATLQAHGARAGFGVDIIDKVLIGDEVASSTRIRGYLRAGDLAGAARLLARPLDVDGVVERGAQRGRALGFPTANIRPDVELVLAPGIYACWLAVEGDAGFSERLPAVASLGTNPTFAEHGGRLVLEVHVLDWSGDLYDRRTRVTFVARLRDEARFDGIEALVAQIHADVASARISLGLG